MNKNEFMKQLSNSLTNLNSVEKKEILADYEEHFAVGLSEGKSEEEICNHLGNPKSIAKQYKVDAILKKAEETKTFSNIFKAVIASFSLGFVNIVFILGPYIGLLAVLISLFSAAFAITVSGTFLLIASLIQPLLQPLIEIAINPFVLFFLSIGMTALGLLFFIGDCYLAKYFYIGTIKYIKLNISIIKK